MLSRLRGSLLILFCASLSFLLAGIGFQKMTEYDDFLKAAQSSHLIGASLNLVYLSAWLIFLAVLLGSLPIASSIIQSALTRKRFGSLFLLAVPLLALGIFLGTTFLLESLFKPGYAGFSARSLLLERGIFLGVLLATVIASMIALCLAALRSSIPTKLLHFALFLSLPETLFMACMLTVLVIWGLSLRSTVPHLFYGNGGILASSTAGSWLGMVLILSLMLLVALLSLLRGFSTHAAFPKSL